MEETSADAGKKSRSVKDPWSQDGEMLPFKEEQRSLPYEGEGAAI